MRLSVLRDRSRATLCPALKNGEIAGRYAYRLNGHIGTDKAFSFRYGVAAARIKFPRLRGQHGSFWMQPVGGMYPGGTGHEIDVTEFFGRTHNRSGLFSYIHRYEGGRIVKTGANIPDTFLHGPRDGWGKNFHVFSVQWTPRWLIFRIDGKETWRIGGRISQVPRVPHPQPAVLRLRAALDQGPTAPPAHVRRLGARLGDRRLAAVRHHCGRSVLLPLGRHHDRHRSDHDQSADDDRQRSPASERISQPRNTATTGLT